MWIQTKKFWFVALRIVDSTRSGGVNKGSTSLCCTKRASISPSADTVSRQIEFSSYPKSLSYWWRQGGDWLHIYAINHPMMSNIVVLVQAVTIAQQFTLLSGLDWGFDCTLLGQFNTFFEGRAAHSKRRFWCVYVQLWSGDGINGTSKPSYYRP